MNDYTTFTTEELNKRADLARHLGTADPKCFALAKEELDKINAVLADRAA